MTRVSVLEAAQHARRYRQRAAIAAALGDVSAAARFSRLAEASQRLAVCAE